MTGPAEVPAASPAARASGPVWHTLSTERVLQEQQVSERDGLSAAEVPARAQRFGPNKFATGKAESRWHAFLRQYADPMQVVLLVAGVGSLYPLKELQTLWINFTTLLFQAIGLGHGQPAAGLMERKPCQPDRPILTRGLLAWLVTVGLIIGVGTLAVISWAEQEHTQAIAHTMGVVTFSLHSLFFSIATRDERRTMFSLDILSDKTFARATGISVLTLILATVFGPLKAFLKTTPLDIQQWLICTGVALSVIVASEIRKAVRRRTAVQAAPASPPAPSPATAAG